MISMNSNHKSNPDPAVGFSDLLGVMAWVSNLLHAFLLTIEHVSKALRQGDKKELHAWLVPLRIEHFLYRMRYPCHSRVSGTILLILCPVQYELAPILRWDTATTLRQKLILFLVKNVVCRDRLKTGRVFRLPDVRIDDSDDGTFVRSRISCVRMTSNEKLSHGKEGVVKTKAAHPVGSSVGLGESE